MGYVLDLAVELPVYQRKQLYAYNANVIDPASFPQEINPYSTPLDRLWEIRFTESAAGSESDSGAGLIIGICLGAAVVIGATVTIIVINKKNKKTAYVIPVDQIDPRDISAYRAFYKTKE
jgi:hypothetical protein